MNPAAPVTRTRIRGPALEADALAEGTPHVDDVLAADIEPAVGAMRRAEHQDVALLEDALERYEPVVADVRVRREHSGTGPHEELAQLVAEGGARVIRFGLERHAEDADRLALHTAVAALERAHDVCREALVDLHRGLTEREVVARERRQLHRVLEQARAGGEAWAGQVGRPRVVLADGPQHVRVV